jgi:hypothetical protein
MKKKILLTPAAISGNILIVRGREETEPLTRTNFALTMGRKEPYYG